MDIVRSRHARTALAVTALLTVASVSAAQVTIFTDRASFEAALGGGFTVETFDALPVQQLGDGEMLMLDDFTILNTGSGRCEIGDATDSFNINGTNHFIGSPTQPSNFITYTFNGSLTGLGAEFDSPTTLGGLRLVLDGTTTIDLVDTLGNEPDTVFFGFTTTTPFSSVVLTTTLTSVEGFGLDDLTFSSMPAATPTMTATATATSTPIPTATAIPTATMLGAPTSTPLPGAPTATPDPSDPIATATPDGGNGGGGSGSACPCGVGSTVPVALLTLGFIALRRRR